MLQPKTGNRCTCRPGLHRDNCPSCEGTGWQIDFAAVHRPNRCACCGESFRNGESGALCHACRGAA